MDKWTGWRSLRLDRRGDLAAASVFTVFFTVFFWLALFGGRFFLSGDPLLYSYPMRMAAWEMVRQGTLPLWTPLIFSGYPLLSMAQLGIGYPLTWVYLFAPGHWAEQIYVLTPYLLTPLFVYAYVREIGLSRMAGVLAGLSFSYGGLMLSLIGLNGMLPNAVMWMPLGLIAVERARSRKFTPSLLLAAGASTMSVLTGVGQGFVYAGGLMFAYALFICVFQPASSEEQSPNWYTWARWAPVLVALGALLLASGISAFQVLETLSVAELSVRAALSYEVFSYGSFPFSLVWKSLIEPLHNGGDATSYVPPLAFLLAVSGTVSGWRRSSGDRRVFFWLAVVVAACVLMMGMYTPLGRAVYQLPVINRFRIPSRHSFEWTFGLSILSAYGWDALKGFARKRRTRAPSKRQAARRGVIIFCLAVAALIGFLWWRGMGKFSAGPPLQFGQLHGSYLGWKAAFLLTTLIATWQCFGIRSTSWRRGLQASMIALACFVEPYIQASHLAIPLSVTAERFNTIAPTTSFLRQYPPGENRVYSQITLSAEAHSPHPRVDPLNLTALAGLHNIAGYEPLMLDRYSRALNSSEWDIVNRSVGLTTNQTLFDPASHVLDLLNTTFVAAYSDLRAEPEALMEKDGVNFATTETTIEVPAEKPLTINVEDVDGVKGAQADTLALVTTMANAAGVNDGTVAAKLLIQTAKGLTIERVLRAGVETAEWAHERADVRPIVRHSLAPIFDSRPGDAGNGFSSHRYLARVNLGGQQRVTRIEITRLAPEASIILWKASLYDSATRLTNPLAMPGDQRFLSTLDQKRWETVYQKDGALILRNRRALPRVWLAAEVETVTAKEAWRRVRGQSEKPFDPRRTALVEIESNNLPALTPGALPETAAARILNYQPNRLTIETNSEQPAFLVVSELFYPGWVAEVDGVETPLYRTNFLLRGVALPAGTHRVEMSYQAPAARRGAVISCCCLLIAGGLAVYAGRGVFIKNENPIL